MNTIVVVMGAAIIITIAMGLTSFAVYLRKMVFDKASYVADLEC